MMMDCVALMSSIDVKCCVCKGSDGWAETPAMRAARGARTVYSARCETSFRRCVWMKCARKYSETSS